MTSAMTYFFSFTGGFKSGQFSGPCPAKDDVVDAALLGMKGRARCQDVQSDYLNGRPTLVIRFTRELARNEEFSALSLYHRP
jgi:hypothetical protein